LRHETRIAPGDCDRG